MQFDMPIVALLMLNIGLVLAFAYYGTRLLGSQSVAVATQIGTESSLSVLQIAFKIPRPTKRFYLPRIRAKSSSDGDEPPCVPH
ncbi:MAG TPA: hypothetical protein VE439_11840 [Anaerolineae bacterium]|jgi:hypothetical protein|nr:hypothetical protein [Anaerolineae bacterium]